MTMEVSSESTVGMLSMTTSRSSCVREGSAISLSLPMSRPEPLMLRLARVPCLPDQIRSRATALAPNCMGHHIPPTPHPPYDMSAFSRRTARASRLTATRRQRRYRGCDPDRAFETSSPVGCHIACTRRLPAMPKGHPLGLVGSLHQKALLPQNRGVAKRRLITALLCHPIRMNRLHAYHPA